MPVSRRHALGERTPGRAVAHPLSEGQHARGDLPVAFTGSAVCGAEWCLGPPAVLLPFNLSNPGDQPDSCLVSLVYGVPGPVPPQTCCVPRLVFEYCFSPIYSASASGRWAFAPAPARCLRLSPLQSLLRSASSPCARSGGFYRSSPRPRASVLSCRLRPSRNLAF